MLRRCNHGTMDPRGSSLGEPQCARSEIDLVARAKQGRSETLGYWYDHSAPQLLRYITAGMDDSEDRLPAHAPGTATRPAHCTILVVDDFEANRQTLARYLKLEGHSTV